MPLRWTAIASLVSFALVLGSGLADPGAARGATRLPDAPVVSAWLRATAPGAAVRAGGRRVALRPRVATRIEVVRTRGRVRVALGHRRWSGALGSIRVTGRARARRVLATGDAPAELIAHRLLAVEPVLSPRWTPDGSAPSGRLRRTRDWKRGFYAGALWRAIEAAPKTGRVLTGVAWKATRALWGGEREDSHDVGFIFGEADAGALRVGCPRAGIDCVRAGRSLRRAAATLHRLAGATPALVIPVQARAGCRICARDERKVFIDSAMNMTPLLAGDQADRALAERHLGFLARELVRPDGSTTQQVLLSTRTGAVTRRLGHDPLDAGSTWARGQAWALRGFAEAAGALGGPWVELAERTADWVAARGGRLPGWDWAARRTARNPGDSSAAAIAAAGLGRLLALRCGAGLPPAVPPERCAAWDRARDALLATAVRDVSRTPGSLGRFAGQRYLWDPSRRIDYRGEYLMGTDYLLEAIETSAGRSRSATSRSTAAGANAASAAAARSR